MSRTFVLDASVLLRWVLSGEIPALAVRARERISADGDAITSDLLPWEVMNAIVISERRNSLGNSFDDAWQRAQDWLTLIRVEPGTQMSLAASAALARRHRLTGYDAGYLELALRYDLPLATLDQQLRQAATAAGVALDL